MLRHGELPFWNQYIFSGTPLLAGFNAGAFYPLVGLFVILPDRVAWIATEVILFSLIAVGMYLFLRALALSTAACVLAAATFSFSGVVLSQVNHVDMTEGFVSIPFMLLAVLHIVRDGRWRWSVLLGVGFALVDFRGAPEAMLDEAILVDRLRRPVGRVRSGPLVAGADPVRGRRRVGPVAVGRAVAAGHRRHLQLAALRPGQRVRRFGELPARGRPAVAGALPLRGLRPPREKPRSSPTTTCPRSASTWGSSRSSPCCRSGAPDGPRGWPAGSA